MGQWNKSRYNIVYVRYNDVRGIFNKVNHGWQSWKLQASFFYVQWLYQQWQQLQHYCAKFFSHYNISIKYSSKSNWPEESYVYIWWFSMFTLTFGNSGRSASFGTYFKWCDSALRKYCFVPKITFQNTLKQSPPTIPRSVVNLIIAQQPCQF